MSIYIQVEYCGRFYTTTDPIDPDEYSTIDLVHDLLNLLKKQHNIVLPSQPCFHYKHPKSNKLMEIGNDMQLMIMLNLFTGKKQIDMVVSNGKKETDLMSTYRRSLGDSVTEKDDMQLDEQEEIHLTSPPQTKPSQGIAFHHTQMPSAPSAHHQTASSQMFHLHLEIIPHVSQGIIPSPVSVGVSEPFRTPLVSSPMVASNQNSGNDVSVNHDSLQIVPRLDERNSTNIDGGDDDTAPMFSDDSWHEDIDKDVGYSSDDKIGSDSGAETDEDDVDIEALEGIRDGGNFSGDEEEGLLSSEKYRAGGKMFEPKSDGTIQLEPRLMFLNKDHFREVMEDYVVQEGIDLYRVANDPWKYTVLCNNLDTCTWRLHASRLADNVTFVIKTIKGEHSCSRLTENPAATSKWIMQQILSELRANKSLTPSSIQEFILEKFGVRVNYIKCFRARKEALKLLEGNHGESYAKLHQYSKIVLERNPGSIIDLQWQDYMNGSPTFSKIFICYNALEDGFLKGCRPFLGVDGCHLKGPYGGVLQSVVAIDGNNGIFPMAFAIVASETTSTWTYFFSNLRLMADEETRRKWVIISDRQKGVEPALNAVMPEVTRRICCRHLYANYKKDNPGVLLRNLLWESTQCYTKSAFKDVLKKIEETSLVAFRYLRDVDYSLWVRFHIPEHVKVTETTSNFVESFNSKLSRIRGSPIFSLLEELRRILMKKVNSRREAISKMPGSITPYAKKVLYRNTKAGTRCGHTASSDFEFEVTEPNRHFIVNLRDMHCDCMAWDISGIPCKHACSVMNWKRINKEQFVHTYFSMSKCAETYSGAISLIPDTSIWPSPADCQIISPPFLKKLPGRPKKQRRREEGEERAKAHRSNHVTCGHCHQIGIIVGLVLVRRIEEMDREKVWKLVLVHEERAVLREEGRS